MNTIDIDKEIEPNDPRVSHDKTNESDKKYENYGESN